MPSRIAGIYGGPTFSKPWNGIPCPWLVTPVLSLDSGKCSLRFGCLNFQFWRFQFWHLRLETVVAFGLVCNRLQCAILVCSFGYPHRRRLALHEVLSRHSSHFWHLHSPRTAISKHFPEMHRASHEAHTDLTSLRISLSHPTNVYQLNCSSNPIQSRATKPKTALRWLSSPSPAAALS
jgi:hypothetical protein